MTRSGRCSRRRAIIRSSVSRSARCGTARGWRRRPATVRSVRSSMARRATGAMALEEFVAIPRLRIVQRRKREVLCRVCCVPGFERPASGPLGLCLLCAKSFRRSGVPSVDEWIRGGQHRKSRRAPRAPARPRATYGRCERCGRLASHPRPLSCGPCQLTWRKAGKPGWERWRREHPVPVAASDRVFDLSPVPERVRLEFLVGLQDALHGERKFNAWSDLTRLARRLAKMRRGIGARRCRESDSNDDGAAAADARPVGGRACAAGS